MTKQNGFARLAQNVVANWIDFLFAAIVGFALSPYLVRHLGATSYGVWALLAALVGYLGLLDLGIRQAVNRYIAHHRVVGAHEQSASIVSAAIKMFGLLGFVAIFLSGVFAYFAPIFFNIPEALVDDTRIVVILGGLTVAVSLIGGVFGGIVTGLERFDIQAALNIVVTTFRAAAIVLVLQRGYGLVALACIQLAGSVLSCFAFWAAARNLYADLRLRLRGDLFLQMRMILSFGTSLTVIYVLNALILNSDAVLIAAFLPVKAVTFFVIAGSLCSYARGISKSLAFVMTPRVSALRSILSRSVGNQILRVSAFATLLITPITVTFVIRGGTFITLWMGPEYASLSGDVLKILAISVWLDASRSVAFHSITGMGKQQTLLSGIAVEAVCKLALSVMLIRPLGILGVALGTLIPSVLVNLTYIPLCLSKTSGVPVRLIRWHALFLPTVACVPFAVASFFVELFFPATNLVVFFLQVILILPLVPLTAWILCLTPAQRARFRLEAGRVSRTIVKGGGI
jgi:O-antigen/teichoic acid export membrane protein